MATLPRLALEYIAAYQALQDLTPIAADCGKLCGARCCSGDDETGMILFPHEALLVHKAGYQITRADLMGLPVEFAVCSGRCDRRLRPLSCRIYPYAPILRDGVVEVIPDPRAKPFCPLLLPEAEPYIQPAYLETIRAVFQKLNAYPAMHRFLERYTLMLCEYQKFM